MIKLLKQIAIFCVFTALIALVFTFVSNSAPVYDASALAASSVEQLNAEIAEEWGSQTQWNSDVYNRQIKAIAQSRNSDLINDDARKSLTDRVNKEACNKALAAMNRQLALTNCDSQALAYNYEGLMTIASRQPGLEKLPEVAQMMRIYSLYCRIISFNRRNLAIGCSFNPASGSWSPKFSPYADGIRRQRNELTSNDIYRTRLSHINDIKQINQTDQKLARARDNYYQSLYRQIENHYQSASANNNNNDNGSLRTKFQNLRGAVYNETSGNGEINNQLRNLYSRLF
jgi:hypothetical protein